MPDIKIKSDLKRARKIIDKLIRKVKKEGDNVSWNLLSDADVKLAIVERRLF